MRSLAVIAAAFLPLVPNLAPAQTTVTPTADSAEALEPLYRSPDRAATFAKILPGAGYIYTGEYLRGYTVWVLTVSGLAVGRIVYDSPCALWVFTMTCISDKRWASRALGITYVAGGLWIWISSVRDARASAERANVRHSRRSSRVSPMLAPSSLVPGEWRAGLAVSW